MIIFYNIIHLMRKTKIIATLGPASDSKQKIEQLIKAGVSVFRFNTKHNSLLWHQERMERVREIAEKLDKRVGIMMVLRGPELRVGKCEGGKVALHKGETIILTSCCTADEKCKEVSVPELKTVQGVQKGDCVYLNDGFLELKISKIINKGRMEAEVVMGGDLKSHKSINFPGAKIDLPSLIKRDLEFLSIPNKKDIDFLSYSFVRNRKDILKLKEIMKKEGVTAKIIAKIETQQAIDNFEEILDETDAVMIARGDLGVEIPMEKLPFWQKKIVKSCRQKTKPVIVATQMLESMTKNPRPTRAEISDVANAVYDRTDCVMLSGETAMGDFPVQAVRTMSRIAEFIEGKLEKDNFELRAEKMNQVIAQAAFKIATSQYAESGAIKKIVILTDTGETARLISSLRPGLEIIALSSNQKVVEQLSLSYGVSAYFFNFPKGKVSSVKQVLKFLKQKKLVKRKEKVILTHGSEWRRPGKTNTLRIQEI